MAAPERTRVVVTDANVLINLIHVGRLELLGSITGYEFVVPPEVVAEVTVPEQAAMLAGAIAGGHVEVQSFSGTAELVVFAELIRMVGKGEAACLAMAEVHGWYVASDERGKFLRLVEERLCPRRILNTVGLFVLAIRAGLITVGDADRDKLVLEAHRFKMRFSSFRDLLGAKTKE
jgi:predicted nucleic acid-binding protein